MHKKIISISLCLVITLLSLTACSKKVISTKGAASKSASSSVSSENSSLESSLDTEISSSSAASTISSKTDSNLIVVPNIVGQKISTEGNIDQQSVGQILTNAGLKGVLISTYSDTQPAYKVYKTVPDTGTKVAKGSSVKIYYSAGKETCRTQSIGSFETKYYGNYQIQQDIKSLILKSSTDQIILTLNVTISWNDSLEPALNFIKNCDYYSTSAKGPFSTSITPKKISNGEPTTLTFTFDRKKLELNSNVTFSYEFETHFSNDESKTMLEVVTPTIDGIVWDS